MEPLAKVRRAVRERILHADKILLTNPKPHESFRERRGSVPCVSDLQLAASLNSASSSFLCLVQGERSGKARRHSRTLC